MVIHHVTSNGTMKNKFFEDAAAELKLNQIELGERLGLSRVSVNRITQGKQPITNTVAHLLLALLMLHRNGLLKIYDRALDEYHHVTHNGAVNDSHGEDDANE